MNPQNPSRAVCVLGAHRSGTSAVARALHLAGLYLGEPQVLLPANPENQEGYWENSRIVDLNQAILERVAGGWQATRPLPESWDGIQSDIEHMKRLLLREFSDRPHWGWKDPRTSLLLPAWQAACGELSADLNYVVCVRHPLDVAQSLIKRNGFSLDYSLGIWANYTLSSLMHTIGREPVVVHYERLVESPDLVLPGVLQNLLGSERVTDELVQKASSAINPQLRHNRAAVEPGDQSRLPRLITDLYELLLGSGPQGAISAELSSRIEDFYQQFWDISSMVADPWQPFKVQAYWPTENGYADAHSVSTVGMQSGEFVEYSLPIPATASRAVRIDPTDVPAELEIRAVEIVSEGSQSLEIAHTFDGTDESNPLSAAHDIRFVQSKGALAAVAFGGDPQLCLSLPEQMQGIPIVVRLSMRASPMAGFAAAALRETARELRTAHVDLASSRREAADLEIHRTNLLEMVKVRDEALNAREEALNALTEERRHLEATLRRLEQEHHKTLGTLQGIQSSRSYRWAQRGARIVSAMRRLTRPGSSRRPR